MTDKARELLERAIEALQENEVEPHSALQEEILSYLAEPEVKREALSDFGVTDLYYSGIVHEDCYLAAFAKGFRMAEKHHGIGGGDENPDA